MTAMSKRFEGIVNVDIRGSVAGVLTLVHRDQPYIDLEREAQAMLMRE